MKRVIIDYKKLTPEILRLLTDKFPDGYGDDDIITFENHHNEIVEAVEVRTEDIIYLVKISSKLHYSMANFEDDLDIDDFSEGDDSNLEINTEDLESEDDD